TRDAMAGMCGRNGALKKKAPLFSDFLSSVIAGLDPAIHREGSRVPVVGWIPGSSPGMTKNKNSPGVTKNKKHCHSECNEESSFINKADLFDWILRFAQDDGEKEKRMTIKKGGQSRMNKTEG
ncbi:MAG: hypothetical protein J6L86_06220, partial [Alphaproteobacteria bacterium]|nr:hypothetical protein [Alphaproteobacteria bacterium]